MYKTITCAGVLLAGALVLTLTAAAQQQPQKMSTDAAVTFNFEHAQVAQVSGDRFWLKGGSADVAVTFFKGLGIAANLTGEHTANLPNNVSLGKIAFMAGPRYTFSALKQRNTQLFGETLFGEAHAFDSVFPGSNGVTATAGAFSMQIGGGVDIGIAKGFNVRALELDYIHTNLPNNASNSQNDFRIGFGVSYRR